MHQDRAWEVAAAIQQEEKPRHSQPMQPLNIKNGCSPSIWLKTSKSFLQDKKRSRSPKAILHWHRGLSDHLQYEIYSLQVKVPTGRGLLEETTHKVVLQPYAQGV